MHDTGTRTAAAEEMLGRLADEYLAALDAGNNPDIEAYARRCPELADLIRAVLPGLVRLRPVPIPASADDDPRLVEAVREYLAALEAGRPLDRSALLARYPDVASALNDALEALAFVQGAGTQLHPGALAGSLAPERQAVGDYRIVREVGRGGMGVVYEAEQLSLGRRVALKVLPFAATLDARQLQRFHNEARAAASLDHPHIVKVHAVGCERGVHYYAMQFIDGQTLDVLIRALRCPSIPGEPTTDEPGQAILARAETPSPGRSTTQPAPPGKEHFRQVALWGIQAAEALEHAHGLGIVHRDIKPANLMIDAQGKLWVTDFGLARTGHDSGLTMSGDLLGTLRYMSPEQAQARHGLVDHRTDLYALGATLYELLTLQPAVAGNDRQEVLRRIADEEPIPPRRLVRSVPAELETVVLKCLAKTAAERYGTARELADDLKRFLADEPIRARRPTWRQGVRRWARRHRAAVIACVLALFVGLGVLAAAIGWVVRDRQVRQVRREDEVRAALREGGEHTDRARSLIRHLPQWERALTAAEAALNRACALADSDEGGLAPDLARELEDLAQRLRGARKDQKMVATVETIWLEQSQTDVQRSTFHHYQAAARYRAAFAAYALVPGRTPPDEAARCLADVHPDVRHALIGALYNWQTTRLAVHGEDDEEALWLGRVLFAVDREGWRRAFLLSIVGKGQTTLAELASRPEALEQPPAILKVLANLLADQGAMPQAIALLLRAVEHHPGDFWLNHILADLLSRGQPPRLAEAIAFFRVARALRPQSPGIWINLGVALRNAKDSAGAEAAFGKAIELAPEYAAAHYNLGIARMDAGNLTGALTAVRQSIALDPQASAPYTLLGILLDRQGKQTEALAAHRKAIERDPKNSSAWFHYGQLLKGTEDLRGAATTLRRAVQLDRNRGEAWSHLGEVLANLKDLPGALAALRRAVVLRPDSSIAHYNLGVVLQETGDLPGAVNAYRQALARNSDDSRAYNNLGVLLGRLGEPAAALAVQRKIVARWPKDAMAWSNLGKALQEKGDLAGALTAYRTAIELQPALAIAHSNLGMALLTTGDLRAALATLRKAIALDGKLPEAHNNLGYTLYLQGKLDEAVVCYRRALQLRPNHHEALTNLGLALFHQNKLPEAKDSLLRALKLKPDLAFAHNNLGLVHKAQGNWNAAIASFRQAIRLSPGTVEAFLNLGNTLCEKGASAQAIPVFIKAKGLVPPNPYAWFYHAMACLAQGDTREHVEVYRDMLARFGTSGNAVASAQLLYLAVLTPGRADADTLNALAQGAGRLASPGIHAAMLLRTGKYAQAVRHLEGEDRQRRAWECGVLTLACHHLGRKDDAKYWRAAARKQEMLLKNNHHVAWYDRQSVANLIREADTLLQGGSAK